MQLAVITGASGHIGYALLKEMQERGIVPRILIRRQSPIFDGIPCNIAYGDITDLQQLELAFAGADVVYHLAGMIEVNSGNAEQLRQVNLEGTKNVVRACLNCGVKKLIYASSVDAFPPLAGDAAMAEITTFDPEALEGVYAKTKAEATRYVFEANSPQLQTIAVYPSACIGPYDFRISNVGEMVRMFLKRKFPVSLAFGGYNFVDVRDVARGMLAAAEQGRAGEGYLLTGEPMTVDGLMQALAAHCATLPGYEKCKAPKLKLPLALAKAVAPPMERYYRITQTTPLFTRYAIRKLRANSNFDCAKAKAELGYTPMSAAQSAADMVDWIIGTEEIR